VDSGEQKFENPPTHVNMPKVKTTEEDVEYYIDPSNIPEGVLKSLRELSQKDHVVFETLLKKLLGTSPIIAFYNTKAHTHTIQIR
jgi:hypothetical protein